MKFISKTIEAQYTELIKDLANKELPEEERKRLVNVRLLTESFIEYVQDMAKSLFSNFSIKLDFLDQIHKLTGDYAAHKLKKVGADEEDIDKPLDEILAEHDRIHETFELIKRTRKQQ
jgi:hypothetical protein